jgi:hypothetical protein
MVKDIERGQSFVLSADVPLTELRDTYVQNDELVAFGQSGRSDAVVVFELPRRQVLDWFYCYQPKRISPDWVASIEWFPSLGGRNVDEVLLLYDLRKTPMENRLGVSRNLDIPPPIESSPVQVGLPIYPQSKVEEGAYENTREVGKPRHINMDTLTPLSSERLAFIASEGTDGADATDWLVIVDLSEGPVRAKSKNVGIPKDKLHVDVEWLKEHRRTYNPNSVKVTRIESVSSTQVRLYVPENIYGVSSIVVDIPRF